MDILASYFSTVEWENIIVGGLRILLILIVVWAVLSSVKRVLGRLHEKWVEQGQEEGQPPSEAAKRAETLIRLLQQGIRLLVWLMASLVVLRELGVEVGPILASVGIVGVAIGFGAQNLVRDVISGFFIILENQVRVGDVAVINGTGGLVEQINFRTMVLRDLEGVVHVFPNGAIDTLSNRTQEWSAHVFEIGVAYKEDTDQVVEILKQVAAELRQDPVFGRLIVEDAEVFGVDAFADSAVIIKGRIKTKPIKQWEVGREFRRRVKQAFDRVGIEIPFPHRTLYTGVVTDPFPIRMAGDAADKGTPDPKAEAENG
ncbi:MAG: mechanosensitive ion channel family protein [Leptospirillia bacterium]